MRGPSNSQKKMPCQRPSWSLAFGDEDGGGSAHERGLDVGVGVAFGVLIFAGFGDEAREGGFDIGGDVGVGVFVNEDAGGGVRDVEVADAGVDGGILHQFGDGGGDVEQLGAALGADGDFAGAGGEIRFHGLGSLSV